MKKSIYVIAFVFGLSSWSLQASVDIQTWTTSKGTKVLFVEAPELPMIDIEVKFDAGSARDNRQPGLASFTANMIGTQTAQLTEQAIADGFNDLGAQFGGDVNRDAASFSLRSLTRADLLNPALDLFEQVINQAAFSETIFQRDRQRLIQGLQQAEEQPASVAQRAFWQGLYGEHPYAHPVSGTVESVESLNIKDLEAFKQRYYVAQNAQIAMVGAITRQQAEKLAEQLTAAMPKGEKPAALAQPKPLTQVKTEAKNEPKTEVIDFQAAQTQYFTGQLAVERGHPDYYALFLGNHLLGGSGFASLLVEEVREKRGLVYSVYSYFAPMRVPGPWIVGLSTANSQALQADEVVKQTLQGFMKDFDEQKLADIKSNLIGGWPLRMDSNSKILGYISMIGFYDLPLDYLDAFPRHIEQLSKAEVLAAWQRHINPDQLFTLMVGQPE